MRTSSLHRSVARALGEAGIPAQGPATLVVGLSGGPDSVALLDVLWTLAPGFELTVVAAHFDHCLRSDSHDDHMFCERLCAERGIRLEAGTGNVLETKREEGGGLEEAARSQRYAYLRSVQKRVGAIAIAVAHTRDDQAETLLLHLARGSGRQGLTGMAPFRNAILRPLLKVSRSEVVEHLRHRGLTWIEDPSNRDLELARNRVRHELIPYLETRFNPRLKERLAELAEIMADEETWLDALTAPHCDRLIDRRGEEATIDTAALGELPIAAARRIVRAAVAQTGGLRGIQARHVASLLRLARRPHASGRRLPLPGHREARVSFQEMRLGKAVGPVRAFALPLPVPGSVTTPSGQTFAARPWDSPQAPREGTIVARGRTEALEVRTRRPGDRILRRGREVSLRRFLMEARVPFEERDALPVVATGRRVLWIPGFPNERGAQADLVHVTARHVLTEMRS